MKGINPQKSQALELLSDARDYMLIVKRNHKKIGEQHTAEWVTITNCEPVERLLDALAVCVTNHNPQAKSNARKIKKWFKDDCFHDELSDILLQTDLISKY